MVNTLSYWSISSIALCHEAQELGLKVEIVSKEKNTFYISDGTKEILFKNTDFGGNSALGYKICDDKGLTYAILERFSLPTAKSHYISKLEFLANNVLDVSHLRKPLIIKPLSEGHGDGVMMNISNDEELQTKLSQSFKIYQDMIIQEQAEGDEVRVIVLKGEVIIARNRIPAAVVGDGQSTVGELIEKENTDNPYRGEGYELPLAYIKIDEELTSFLSKKGKNIDDVPEKEEYIQLRGNSNIGTGGTMKNVTDIIHPSTKEICIQAAQVLGLDMAGVDVLAQDISKPLTDQGGIILEVNATSGLGGEKELAGVNTAEIILKTLFEL